MWTAGAAEYCTGAAEYCTGAAEYCTGAAECCTGAASNPPKRSQPPHLLMITVLEYFKVRGPDSSFVVPFPVLQRSKEGVFQPKTKTLPVLNPMEVCADPSLH